MSKVQEVMDVMVNIQADSPADAMNPATIEGLGGSSSETPVLQVSNLAFRYARQDVWSDVSFRLNAGEVAFLTGFNGSGKSTLLRCLAGWDTPQEGEVLLCGRTLTGADRAQRRLVSFVPDSPSFYDDLTAGEHLQFMLAANRVAVDDSAVAQLLDTFELAAFKNQYPSSYSRGMRQKFALTLALLARPRLLLLDEPYGPLDPEASRRLSGLLAQARDGGMTVLASCHHEVPELRPDVLLTIKEGHLETLRPAAQCDTSDFDDVSRHCTATTKQDAQHACHKISTTASDRH